MPDLVGEHRPLLVLVGINPSLLTAATGAHFAHPSNRFYPALHAAGITDRRLDPSGGLSAADEAQLLSRGVAITNVVARSRARGRSPGRGRGEARLVAARRHWASWTGVPDCRGSCTPAARQLERLRDVPDARVRPAVPDDLPRTARLHRRALPDGFFARLGTSFLRWYHRAFAESPAAEVLVARGRSGPQGVLVGTFDNAAHYRWVLRRRGPILLLVGLAALLRRPRLAAEFARTRVGRYARAVLRAARPGRRRPEGPEASRSGAAGADGAGQVAVLTHVAVAETARGTGTGKELVRAFLRDARCQGADEVRLITGCGSPAAGFYRSLGWESRGTRRASDGTFVEEFVHVL